MSTDGAGASKVDERSLAGWEAQRRRAEARVSAEIGFEAGGDVASLIARFFAAWGDRYSPDRQHPPLGPVVRRAERRYQAIRGHDHRFCTHVVLTEAIRDILSRAPAPAKGGETLEAVTADRDRLRDALAALMRCPFLIDPDTVPRGKQPCEAPDQVVGNMSVSGRLFANAKAALNGGQPVVDTVVDPWRPDAESVNAGCWLPMRERATGRTFQARWEADAGLAGGGAWLAKGETGYLDPDQASRQWEFAHAG